MKKYFVLLLALVAAFSLAGCNKTTEAPATEKTTVAEIVPEEIWLKGSDSEWAALDDHKLSAAPQEDTFEITIKLAKNVEIMFANADDSWKITELSDANFEKSGNGILVKEAGKYHFTVNAKTKAVTVENVTVAPMTYAEFMAAADDTEVCVTGVVTGLYEYSENYKNTSFYMADEDGAYYVYRATFESKEAYEDALSVGASIKVTGVKASWSGEVEIKNPEIEALEEELTALDPVDLSGKLQDADLIKYMNQKAYFHGLTIAASTNADGEEVGWLYKYDGTGQEGDDIYFNVTDGEHTYQFLVESDFFGKDSEVYAQAKTLEIGEEVFLEGFVYWYNGINTQISNIIKISSYSEFMSAQDNDYVAIKGVITGLYEYSENYKNTSFYMADEDGAYYVYRATYPTKEAYNASLALGKTVLVVGQKSTWSGEVEVKNPQVFSTEDTITPIATSELGDKLASDTLINYMNQKATFTGLTIAASTNADGEEVGWLYKYDGTGQEGDDIYFNVTDGEHTYQFLVESDFFGKDSDVYKAAKTLSIGDTVNLEGFVYWYNGINTQVSSIQIVEK